MMSFKFTGSLFLVSLFLIKEVEADCSDAEAKKINNCYAPVFEQLGINADPFIYRKILEQSIASSISVKKICSGKKDLDSCIGSDTIKNCFNTKDFQKVAFAYKNESSSRYMVTNYIQMDYACSSVYDLTLSSVDCIFTKVIGCDPTVHKCDDYTNYISCENQRTKQTCGKPAACFIQKYLTLENCYDFPECNNICETYATTLPSNPLDGICKEDQDYSGVGFHEGNHIFVCLNLLVLNFLFYLMV